MTDQRILVPQDEKTAIGFIDGVLDERSAFDAVEFTLAQKFELMRHLTSKLPAFRPSGGDRGKIVPAESASLLLDVLVEARKCVTAVDFKSVLDRSVFIVQRARDTGRPIWLFR